MNYKKLFLSLAVFMFLFVIISANITAAEFNKSDVSTWAQDKESVLKFEKLSDKDKNEAWKSATPEVREKFVKSYLESKGKKTEFSGSSSKDLSWEGNRLAVVSGKKKPSFDFNCRDSLKKVTYDEKSKTFLYEFEKGDTKNQVKIDDGYIDKDGYLSKDTSSLGFTGFYTKTEKIANVVVGNGLLEYNDGSFYISTSGRSVKIGNSYYSHGIEGEQTIIRPDSATGAVYSHNAKVLLMEKADSAYASAVFSTTAGKDKDGNPAFVALFESKAVPKDFKDPYAFVDLASKSALLNDNFKNTGKATYMELELFSDFKSIGGSGTQAWVKNGEAQLDFSEGNILFVDGMNKGTYNIDSIANLDNTGKVFTFKKYGDNAYTDFFERGGTFVNSGALVSETSGLYVTGPRGRVLGGKSETGYSDINYPIELSEGYFKGTEAERLLAIANDPNTVVGVHGTPSVSIPGQYFASEVLSTLDYQMAVAGLQAADMGKDLNSQMAQMKLLADNYGDLSNPANKAALVDRMISGASAVGFKIEGTADFFRKQNPDMTDIEIRQKTEQLVNGYILRSNYNPKFDYSTVTSENINSMPSVNRLLYEAATNYQGTVDIPDTVREARKSGGASSSGGIANIEVKSDGVYFDGNKVEGIKPEVAAALKTTVAGGLLTFDTGVSEREAQVAKYGTKINEAGYPFDINDYKTERHTSNVYVTGLIGAKQVGACALAQGKCQLAEKESKYQYYKTNNRLP